ncbi:MAG: Ig-like domain-containing protein [Flavisolibacter sp.]
MRKTYFFTALLFISVAAFWSFVPTGCANIIPPAGGPRDTLPPALVKAEPGDSALNFRAKQVVLTFDELIDLKDVANNLIFTPIFERSPIITAKGRTLTIPFRDTLQPNTTYVLNFGNAIVDINEGNPLTNFTYTFSTGPALDSLELNGRVIVAETGGIDTTLTVLLHKRLNDSAVMNNTPMYAVRLDREGNFHFKHLPRDTFAIYALGDAGTVRRYMDRRKLFAFADHPVIAGQRDSIILYAYQEQPAVAATSQAAAPRIPVGDRRLRFTPPPAGTHDLHSDYILNFQVPLRALDTGRIHLTTDSLFNPTSYTAHLDSTRKELRIASTWKENTQYNLVLEKDFATDTSGRQLLKTDTLFFTTKKNADYGNLVLRFRNLDLSKKPVLQFLQNGAVVFSAPLTSNVFSNPLFQAGDYDLRIFFDANGNGIWDPGQFFGGKKQPELVKQLDVKVTVKPDWENEKEIAL